MVEAVIVEKWDVKNLSKRGIVGINFNHDSHSYKGIIEKAPLQAFSSALIFSPTNSLTRKLFQGEGPGWIVRKPQVEENLDACLMTLEGHSGSVLSVAFSPDSQYIASSSDDNAIKSWDAESGSYLATREDHSDPVELVAFSHDGQQIASGSWDKTIKIWDVDSGHCITTLYIGRVALGLSFAPTSSHLYTDAGVISLEESSNFAPWTTTTTSL